MIALVARRGVAWRVVTPQTRRRKKDTRNLPNVSSVSACNLITLYTSEAKRCGGSSAKKRQYIAAIRSGYSFFFCFFVFVSQQQERVRYTLIIIIIIGIISSRSILRFICTQFGRTMAGMGIHSTDICITTHTKNYNNRMNDQMQKKWNKCVCAWSMWLWALIASRSSPPNLDSDIIFHFWWHLNCDN